MCSPPGPCSLSRKQRQRCTGRTTGRSQVTGFSPWSLVGWCGGPPGLPGGGGLSGDSRVDHAASTHWTDMQVVPELGGAPRGNMVRCLGYRVGRKRQKQAGSSGASVMWCRFCRVSTCSLLCQNRPVVQGRESSSTNHRASPPLITVLS